jgi:hypothetical protein
MSQPSSKTERCLNCGAAPAENAGFCAVCGQRTDVPPKLTMRDIGHDLVHAITHADHSIFALIRAMLTKPGHVARDYADGKRKRHFGPFAFLLIAVGFASAIVLMSGVQWFTPFHRDAAGEAMQRHVTLVILAQAPLLAAFSALLFRGDRRNFAEHLVLAAYTSGFHALFLALIETPLLALTRADTANPWLASGYFGVWILYFAFACSQFYRGNRLWSFARGLGAAILSQAAVIALVMGVLFSMTRLHD